MLHGLSLLAITAVLFGAIAYFALGRFPLRCSCKDGTAQAGTRSGFDSPEKRCQQVCAKRGGGAPFVKSKDPGKGGMAKEAR